MRCALDDPLPYEALSYCWGCASFTSSILVESQAFGITANLEAALRHCRRDDQECLLWVDAISINQSSLEERSQQVQMMLEIYSKATKLHAFLGPGNPDTHIGMSILQDLLQPKDELDPILIHLSPDLLRAGLVDVLHREYWRRMWVIQEAAVARKVTFICGTDRISWENPIKPVRAFEQSVKLAGISPQWSTAGLRKIILEPILQLLQLQLDTGPKAGLWKANRPAADMLNV